MTSDSVAALEFTGVIPIDVLAAQVRSWPTREHVGAVQNPACPLSISSLADADRVDSLARGSEAGLGSLGDRSADLPAIAPRHCGASR